MEAGILDFQKLLSLLIDVAQMSTTISSAEYMCKCLWNVLMNVENSFQMYSSIVILTKSVCFQYLF